MNSFYRSTAKALVVMLLLGSLVSFAAPQASAFPVADNKNDKGSDRATSNESSAVASEVVTAEAKPLNIYYTPLNNSIAFEPAAQPVQPDAAATHLLKVNLHPSVASAGIALPSATGNVVPVPPAKEPLTKIPMTVGEKFGLFFKSSFLSVGPYANSAFSGIRGEAFDKDHDPNGDHGHYFADAGTRAARSFAFGASSKFFERFLYASIFRQDPRFFRSGKKGAGARIGYAISRVFVTQGDKGGSQFNISFLGGGLSAAYLAKTWEREERKTTQKIFSKWGNHVAMTALTNILREFLAGQ